MQIEYIDNLLQTSMTIRYKGRSLTIDDLVIDTGAAHSLISSDIAAQIGIHFENGDKLVRSFGIGGGDYSFRKQIDQVQLERVFKPLIRPNDGRGQFQEGNKGTS